MHWWWTVVSRCIVKEMDLQDIYFLSTVSQILSFLLGFNYLVFISLNLYVKFKLPARVACLFIQPHGEFKSFLFYASFY